VRLLAFLLALFAAQVSLAAGRVYDPRVEACIEEAGRSFAISPLSLRVLYRMEGGTLGKVSQNTNGTVDIGPMQINSWWLPKIAPAGINYEMLRDDPCTNVYVAAWIFEGELLRAKGDIAMAIAKYHSPTPVHQARYLKRVTQILDGMIAAQSKQEASAQRASTPAQSASTSTQPRKQHLRSIASVAAPVAR